MTHVTSHPNACNAPHAIVPDILAHNYTAGCQTVDHSGATTSAPAIFKIKTYTSCKSRYDHANTMHPADRRVKDIKNEYVCKFRNLDTVFAADVGGDKPGVIEGPFTRDQQCFHTKQMIWLCAAAQSPQGSRRRTSPTELRRTRIRRTL